MTTPAHESLVQALRDARRAIDTLRDELRELDRDAIRAAADRNAIRAAAERDAERAASERKALSLRIKALENTLGDPDPLRAVVTANHNDRLSWSVGLAVILGLLGVLGLLSKLGWI